MHLINHSFEFIQSLRIRLFFFVLDHDAFETEWKMKSKRRRFNV